MDQSAIMTENYKSLQLQIHSHGSKSAIMTENYKSLQLQIHSHGSVCHYD